MFRAATVSNPNNPLATRLYVICRNARNELILAPDTLKKNLAIYLNEHRMISDSIDILDVPVINFQIEFKILTDPSQAKRQLVLQNVLAKLQDYFNIKNFEINQQISIEHVRNLIFNSPGVIGVESVKFKNVTGTIGIRTYSSVQFDISTNTKRGFIVGPPGSMFEIKHKDQDIVGILT